jgi:transposase
MERSPYLIKLSDTDRQELEKRARNQTAEYREVVRARIILYAAEGLTNQEIADRLDTPRKVVSMWRKRYFERGLSGLEDQPRSGRPARFSPQRGHGSQSGRL